MSLTHPASSAQPLAKPLFVSVLTHQPETNTFGFLDPEAQCSSWPSLLPWVVLMVLLLGFSRRAAVTMLSLPHPCAQHGVHILRALNSHECWVHPTAGMSSPCAGGQLADVLAEGPIYHAAAQGWPLCLVFVGWTTLELQARSLSSPCSVSGLAFYQGKSAGIQESFADQYRPQSWLKEADGISQCWS